MTADPNVELGRRISKLAAEWLKEARDLELLSQVFASTNSPLLQRRSTQLLIKADLEREHARQLLGFERRDDAQLEMLL